MMRFEMAFGKAYASLALGRSSDLVRQRAEHRPMFMEYMIGASRGQIFPEGGGQLIRDGNGDVIGAVGVAGDLQHKDDELAAYGIRAAGLKTDDDCSELGTQVRVARYESARTHGRHSMAKLTRREVIATGAAAAMPLPFSLWGSAGKFGCRRSSS